MHHSPTITTTHHAGQRSIELAVSILLAAVDPALIESYGADLRTRFGFAVGVEHVLDHATWIVNANPLDDAIDGMRRAGFDPIQDGNRIEITEDVTSATGSAHTAISRCRNVDLVLVICRTTGSWSLAAWQQPHLLVLQLGANGRGWGVVYRMSGAGLVALHSGELRGITDREVEMFTPLAEPRNLAAQVLQTTGWTRDGSVARRSNPDDEHRTDADSTTLAEPGAHDV